MNETVYLNPKKKKSKKIFYSDFSKKNKNKNNFYT